LLPDLYEQIYHKIPIEYVDPSWVLHVIQGRPIFNRLQLAVKRLLDLGLVLASLPILVLVLPVIALAIRLDSIGPIFYHQIRCGRAGRPFSIFKFRTMSINAELDGQPRWATQSDVRITRVGRILRKTRLDELPQLINVLRGEMSLIGPRPERPEFVEMLQQQIPFYRTRLMVKPGLTGWAQIHYDYGNSVEDALIKLQYDFYYLRYWSVWLDLYVAFRTFAVVLKLKGM
jgi:exopolysaccharide biosynthesis polyprenyl glycosylphosphotransferase